MKDRNITALLGSTTDPKVEGVMGGLVDANPLRGVIDRVIGRRLIVVKHTSDGVEIREEAKGLERFLPRRHLGRVNAILPGERSITVVAYEADSSFPNQPRVERRIDLEQGFQGAANRLDAVLKRGSDRKRKPRLPWRVAFGIENAQMGMTVPGRQESQIDVGFIVAQDRLGNRSVATSAGVVFGTNFGLEFYEKSADSGFEVPAGHIFNPEEPRDPHKKQTRGILHRAALLRQAVAIAYTSLPEKK